MGIGVTLQPTFQFLRLAMVNKEQVACYTNDVFKLVHRFMVDNLVIIYPLRQFSNLRTHTMLDGQTLTIHTVHDHSLEQ